MKKIFFIMILILLAGCSDSGTVYTNYADQDVVDAVSHTLGESDDRIIYIGDSLTFHFIDENGAGVANAEITAMLQPNTDEENSILPEIFGESDSDGYVQWNTAKEGTYNIYLNNFVDDLYYETEATITMRNFDTIVELICIENIIDTQPRT